MGAESERPARPAPAGRRSGNALLWLAAAAFAVMLAAWTTFLIIAHRHAVAAVPVAPAGRSAP